MKGGPQGQPLRVNELWMSAAGRKCEMQAQAAEVTAAVERVVAGDASAFERIVIAYERRVVNLAWRMLGTLDDAKDAAQEVFFRAFRYLHRYDTRKPIEAWLVHITLNVCRDLGRRGQQRRSAVLELENPDLSSDPYSDLARDERKRLLDKALQGLSEKERSALVLRDIEGFSTAETAALLGRSEASVRALIGRARVKMKAALTRMKGGLA